MSSEEFLENEMKMRVGGVEEEEVEEEVEKEKEKEEKEEEDVSSCPSKSLYAICADNAKGYVPLKVWDKISTLPETMREKILKPLKSTVPLSSDERAKRADQDEGMIVDLFYVQEKENIDTYHKLGIVIDKEKKKKGKSFYNDSENVNLAALTKISSQIDNMNYFLFFLEKYRPDLYSKFMDLDIKESKQRRRK